MVRTRICAVCKELIDEVRATDLPETQLCGRHAEEIDKYGGEFLMSASQERTSKPGSLKLNFGGVTTSKTRNLEGIQRLRDEFLEQS